MGVAVKITGFDREVFIEVVGADLKENVVTLLRQAKFLGELRVVVEAVAGRDVKERLAVQFPDHFRTTDQATIDIGPLEIVNGVIAGD